MKITGVTAMRGKLAVVGALSIGRIETALRLEAEGIMTWSKRTFVPVDLGPLRASGSVDDVRRDSHKISVELGFGDSTVDYALNQHENPNYAHNGTTSWKYLDRPMKGRVAGMAKRIAIAAKI